MPDCLGSAPSGFDWRTEGNQKEGAGTCHSCWYEFSLIFSQIRFEDVEILFWALEENIYDLGNVTPIDVYSHFPAMCEDKVRTLAILLAHWNKLLNLSQKFIFQDYPYCFTPSREHLGLAAGHKRPSVVMMIRPSEDYQVSTSSLYSSF